MTFCKKKKKENLYSTLLQSKEKKCIFHNAFYKSYME
jgi:hypothetical protein